LVIPRDVVQELRTANFHVDEGMVTKALKALGGVPAGQLPPRRLWTDRPRCWAMRNSDHWMAVGPAAMADHLVTHSLEKLAVPAGHFGK
jgi:hypothetical protein